MKYFIPVAVFEMKKKKSIHVYAYTRDYNEQWEGCCMHQVYVEKKRDAKKVAIEAHKKYCMKNRKEKEDEKIS